MTIISKENETKILNKEKEWKEQLEYFKSIRRKLLQDPQYKNKYIAICDKEIISTGLDKFKLYIDAHQKYPNKQVLIVIVEPEERVVRIDTPRIVK